MKASTTRTHHVTSLEVCRDRYSDFSTIEIIGKTDEGMSVSIIFFSAEPLALHDVVAVVADEAHDPLELEEPEV